MRKARVIGTAAALVGAAVVASKMISRRRSRNADGTFKSGNQGGNVSSNRAPGYDRSSRRSRRARRSSR